MEEGAEDFLLKPVKLSDVKRLKDFILKGEETIEEVTTHKRKLTDGDDPSLSSSIEYDPSSPPPSALKRPRL